MSGVWKCPRNHSWRTQPADADATLDIKQDCPVCGEPGTWRSDAGTLIDASVVKDTARPAAVPGYEIHEEIGRGAMGVVYRARDLQLNRTVALKMILAGAHAAPVDRARFRREVESVAALQHPNILQIHSVGEVDGLPYCALEYVPGGTLSKRLKEGPLPPNTAARLISTLARATHYAHQNGIIHRDLKPGNVLITGGSSDSSKDKLTSIKSSVVDELLPKIADFGLAKRLDADVSLTGSSAVLGTPSNMAPEQADGRNRTITAAADVYSLGTILYECLTGRAVFRAGSPLETLHQVINEDPPSLRSVDAKIPRDLETVCLKCLRKDPTQRYASASEFADDLDRYLAGEPVLARATGVAERVWRQVSKHNAMTVALTLAVSVALMALFLNKLRVFSGRDPAVDQIVVKGPIPPSELKAPTIVVKAMTDVTEEKDGKPVLTSHTAQGNGFLTSERGVIQVSSDLLGMTDVNSPRPKTIEVTIRHPDGSETSHTGEVALIEPRFKLALVRIVGGTLPEPEKTKEPVEAKPVESANAAPNQITADTLDRMKRGTVAVRWKRHDGTRSSVTGCVVDLAGTIITPLADVEESMTAGPVEELTATMLAGTKEEQQKPAQLLELDRTTGLAIFHVDLSNGVNPLVLGSAKNLLEGQTLYVATVPTMAKSPNLSVSPKFRQATMSGRIVTRAGGLRYLQLEGGVDSNGFIFNTAGEIIGFTAERVSGSNMCFATPVEVARELLRGRIAELTPNQPYEVAGHIELTVEAKVIDPLRQIGKLVLDIWTGKPGDDRRSSDSIPTMRPGDGAVTQVGLGAVADPDRKAGQPRRFSGAAELPIARPGEVYWARAHYLSMNSKERWGEAVILPLSSLVKRDPAKFDVPFTSGESDVRLVTNSRSKLGELNAIGQTVFAFSEQWTERLPQGDRVTVRCTQFSMSDRERELPGFRELPIVKGMTGTLTAGLDGPIKIKTEFPKETSTTGGKEKHAAEKGIAWIAPEQLVKAIEHSSIDYIYSFVLKNPPADMQPDDSWTERVSPLGNTELKTIPDQLIALTRFQYLGRRQVNGRDEALVSWTGRSVPPSTVSGTHRGAIAIDLQTGRVRLGWRKLEIAGVHNAVFKKIQHTQSVEFILQRTFDAHGQPIAGDRCDLPGRSIEIVPFISLAAAP